MRGATTLALLPAPLSAFSSRMFDPPRPSFNPLKKLEMGLCEFKALEGPVSDCSCSFEDVDHSTAAYFGPLLIELTQRKFFKYFKVNLDAECAFWPDDGQCDRFECSVDQTCDELPDVWRLEEELRSEWRAGSLSHQEEEMPFLCEPKNIPVDRDHDELNDWSETGGDEVWIEQSDDTDMVYVDLLKNPEKFTGYDGEKARRIWRAIHEENCFSPPRPREFVLEAFRRFGQESDEKAPYNSGECLERRVYFRLMSGLQASISTHIAKSTFSAYDVVFKFTKPEDRLKIAVGLLVDRLVYGSKEHGVVNDPVFVARVGSHPDRLHNLYFTYLFVLRAVQKARADLLAYDYDTGDPQDDLRTRSLVAKLVDSTGWDALLPLDDDDDDDLDDLVGAAVDPFVGGGAHENDNETTSSWAFGAFLEAVVNTTTSIKRLAGDTPRETRDARALAAKNLGTCVSAARRAFDESALFRVPVARGMTPLEKALARESVEELRAEFLARFRNVSRVMDCVTCERCRLWGKLQVLGLGTALKILLMQGDESGIGTLQRNEVVALVNTLAQLAKSVDSIKDWQQRARVRAVAMALVYASGAILQVALFNLLWRRLFASSSRHKKQTGLSASSGGGVTEEPPPPQNHDDGATKSD